ncbi:HET-domain-containing protein [Hyaloscypha variabilis F]|uniref:HET-domain-containing protein n=1 Tax=Hyaloscypha variabilis (strain UAMH 11265 / GT02V1 / F) TaxID=1149755 RepID=A0A2J6R6U4_HYAVF|nr:HET-domain-containing protein [Hyaloscypha variabilis F]
MVAVNLYFSRGVEIGWGLECSLCCFRLRPNPGIFQNSYPEKDKLTLQGSLIPNTCSIGTEPESYLAMARKWLETCLEKHPECIGINAQKGSLKLPARLLQIGSPTPEKICLWIVPAEEKSKPVQYMTLSHCWGTFPILTLTETTREQMLEGILITALPKTFRDAVFIANQIGVKFLWIDSLCIMQDSLSDWEQEASLMADVYRGSLCNIAATGSSHANEGCLYERCAPVTPCVITTSWDDMSTQEYVLYDELFWEKVFENDPLKQRAWVVQELLLAPRVLYLSKRQMIWECYETSLCEMYPDGAPEFIGEVPKKLRLEDILAWKDIGGTIYPATAWSELVHNYTSCNLTKPGDKLIALSGVAKRLEEYTQDEYLAGLWRKHLPSQLLWEITLDQAGPLVPAKVYRAPSWSWASVDGRLSCPSWRRQCTLIKILEAYVDPAGRDRTGAVKGGLIRLTGPLRAIEFEESKPIGVIRQFRFRFRHHSSDQHTATCESSSPLSPHNMHCLAVNKRKEENERLDTYDCLLLVPTGSLHGQFYRWGTLTIWEEKQIRDFHIRDNLSGSEGCLQYEKSHGEGIYTISII